MNVKNTSFLSDLHAALLTLETAALHIIFTELSGYIGFQLCFILN